MEELELKRRNKAYSLLILATFLTYIVLTGSKNLYIAEKTTLQSLGTFGSFTDLAITMEYYFYSYAVMQILLVFVMKRLNLKWFLTLTLGASACITILMAFTDTIVSHWILYTVNGALQAGVWGCSLKTLAQYLPQRKLSTANKLMTSGPAVAGVISYGAAALFGENWQAPFIVLGVILLLSLTLFFFSVGYINRFPQEDDFFAFDTKVKPEQASDFIPLDSKKRLFVFYLCSIVLGAGVTALFFAMNNTLDIFLKQMGGFDNTSAKWTTVLAPIAFIIGPILCVNACDKHKNFLSIGAIFFSLALVTAILLLCFFKVSVALSIVLLLFYLVLTNGGRSISLSIIALKLRDKIDTGVYSTLVNAAASISSGVIPKLFTAIIDNPNLTATQNWANAFTVLIIANAVIVAVIIALNLLIKRLTKST